MCVWICIRIYTHSPKYINAACLVFAMLLVWEGLFIVIGKLLWEALHLTDRENSICDTSTSVSPLRKAHRATEAEGKGSVSLQSWSWHLKDNEQVVSPVHCSHDGKTYPLVQKWQSVMGAASGFLRLGSLYRKKYKLGTANLAPNPCFGEFLGPKSESTEVILLNGHSIKLPSKFIPLCQYISVSLRHHQRSLHIVGDS